MCNVRYFGWMRRYRLIDEETGANLGPFVSQRTAFQVGEQLARIPAERYVLVNVVPAENENFRAYLVVRQLREDEGARHQDSRAAVPPQEGSS